MTFQESIPLAKKLAENTLDRGFDVEAFLVLCELNRLNVVPESNIDESLQYILNRFTSYYNTHELKTFQDLLTTLRQVISELYQNCNSDEERNVITQFIQSITTII